MLFPCLKVQRQEIIVSLSLTSYIINKINESIPKLIPNQAQKDNTSIHECTTRKESYPIHKVRNNHTKCAKDISTISN